MTRFDSEVPDKTVGTHGTFPVLRIRIQDCKNDYRKEISFLEALDFLFLGGGDGWLGGFSCSLNLGINIFKFLI
jgi:hypothetical protein